MSRPDRKEPGKLYLFFSALWELVHRNWGFKLLALLLAVILWAGLITQDPSLTRQKVMTADGSAIEISGATNAARTRYGSYIVTAGLDELPEIAITVDVPQLNYQNASAADYAPYIDLRGISGVGEQEIPISTRTTGKTGKVTKIEPASVTLTVDRYVTAGQIAVNPVTEGTLDGWYLADLKTVRDNTVTISGPESIVAAVRAVEAVLDLSALADENGALRENYRQYVGTTRSENWPFRLVCDGGVTFDSDELEAFQITVTHGNAAVTTIPLSYTVMACRTLSLAPDAAVTAGAPAEGCAVAKIVKPTVTVAGSESDLANLTSFRLEAPVNIEGRSDTVTATVAARIDSAAALVWLDSDGRPMEGDSHGVDVTVVIRPEIPVNPAVTGALPAGWELEGEPLCSPDAVTVINADREAAALEAVLDLSALKPSKAGTFTVTVPCRLLDGDGQEIAAGSQVEIRSNASLQTAISVTYTVKAMVSAMEQTADFADAMAALEAEETGEAVEAEAVETAEEAGSPSEEAAPAVPAEASAEAAS